jgi:hypothetical protein
MNGCKEEMSKESRDIGRTDMMSQKIKKVDQAEIFTIGLERGREIALLAKTTLGKQLKSTIQDQGVGEAIRYCNIAAYPLVDSLSKSYGASIRRTSLRIRNPEDAPDSLERMLLEAYAYNIENDQPLNESIQEYDSKYLLYTKPIMIEGALCLACHGSPGTNVSAETEDLIKSLYPDDNAMNHALSDLRGMWSIKLPIKDIVNDMNK